VQFGSNTTLFHYFCSEEGLKISLPEPGHYATGLFFIQNDAQQVQKCSLKVLSRPSLQERKCQKFRNNSRFVRIIIIVYCVQIPLTQGWKTECFAIIYSSQRMSLQCQ
jgi:hypothetical protein